MTAVLEYEKRGHVSIVTLNRPERLNALSDELYQALLDAWTQFSEDDDAWIAILTGTGRAFCAGADLKERAETGRFPGESPPAAARFHEIYRNSKPTIVAVNGVAAGAGFGMCLGADLRIATDSATFQFSEVNRGLTAGHDLQVGHGFPSGVAAEIASGGTVTAQRLYDIGFLNKVVPGGGALPAALEMAESLLVRVPPLTLRYNFRLMRMLRSSMPRAEVAAAAQAFRPELRASDDFKESMRSFLEKRKPVYQAR